MTDTLSRVALPLGLLAAAAFLSSAGARVIDPLLHVIATDFATTVPAVSIVVAAYTLPYGLCQIFLGPLGDRAGKLRVILAALLAYALATGACALAGSLPALTALRVAAGAASAGLIPVGMAYIGDAVPYRDRQVMLGRFLNGVVLAQVMAGPLGGVFGQYLGWRGVFVLLAAGALLVAAALALRIGRLPDRRSGAAGFHLGNYLALTRHRFARRLLLCALLDGMVLVGCFPFLAPYMHEAFDLPYAVVGLVLSCFGIGALAYTRLVKRLVPLLGEPGLVVAGGVVTSGAIVAGMLSPWWQVFIPVQMLMGLGFFLLHGVMQARATEMLPNARATAVSSFAFMLFMGQSAGALAMGALIARFGYRGAFFIDAACILALGFLLRGLMRRRSE
ncbi:MFS transporter [Limobrevibacterium gyesilva]|uniref:MFS transporter n=1 Tax=Limobrevibacterium gyesilva TaxID=2991712 RepID=A0AA41YRI3_9PROT|nr:MFS transporter [Limobrevibacterium gyesilva]MCW3476983.1 MFS transporter [Limobrevibacterium gyesilva]